MPITSSAKKAMRRDRRRQAVNYRIRARVKAVIDTIRKGSNDKEDLSKMQSTLDKAAKRRVLHPKKAARLKSRLNKLAKTRSSEDKPKKAVKKAVKKTTKKASTAKKAVKKTAKKAPAKKKATSKK